MSTVELTKEVINSSRLTCGLSLTCDANDVKLPASSRIAPHQPV
ncbi:hypothetical protein AB0A05_07730 [Streptomyces sp. NPDC046374]